MSKWVQHKSGQGEKYVAEDEDMYTWKVPIKERYSNLLRWDLPKSEYIECLPPVTWCDATDEFQVSKSGGNLICKTDGTWLSSKHDGYRLRKVELYRAHPDSNQNCTQQAFIIEKRQP